MFSCFTFRYDGNVKDEIPVRGFQEEVCDEGFMVKVKVEMDENKMKKKKNKKITQGHDSVNETSKKRKIDQEQSQPFPRVDQYLNKRAIKNAQRKRKIAEEGDKGNNQKRKIDMQVDVQKNGDEVQKKRSKKGKQTVSSYDEANDQGKQDVSTIDEKADDGKKGIQTVSTEKGKQDVSTDNEKADDRKKGKQTVSTEKGKQDVSTKDEKVDHETEAQEGNASEGDVKKKNGENRDKDVKPETFEVHADDDNEIIQNKSSDGQQGKQDHGKEGKHDVGTGKQEGKQTVSTYHEADAESSDDKNGDTDLQPIEAGDDDNNEIIEIKSP